jgi:pimeloyl-ACP methyl ester carboxylesterase
MAILVKRQKRKNYSFTLKLNKSFKKNYLKLNKMKKVIIAMTITLFAFSQNIFSQNVKSKKMEKSKTFVLVHGAFAGKYAWDKVKSALEKEGYKVIVFDLPGHGVDNTAPAAATLESYVKTTINKINEQQGTVILVGHSMGGMVISQVAEQIPDKIEKLVYLSAFLPKDGEDMISLASNPNNKESVVTNDKLEFSTDFSSATLKKEIVIPSFAEDCDAATQQLILSKQRPEPTAVFQAKMHLTPQNFGSIPKYYIETTHDKNVGVSLQRWMASRNGNIEKVFSLASGHSPYFEKPSELTAILKEISAIKITLTTKPSIENIVRISIGYFQPEQTEKVESMLNNEFKNLLIPAIQKLKGNLGYYVAIDKEKHAMTNVSFWQTKEDAMQMATLKEMLDMRITFETLGLKFIEITNHDILWKL